MTSIVSSSWKFANNTLPAGGLILVADRYLQHRRTNGNDDRKKKRDAKQALEIAVNQNNYLQKLNIRLVESVLESNKKLEKDIRNLRKKQLNEAQKPATLRDNDKIKGLAARLERLENLKVDAALYEKEDPQTKLV